MESRPETMTKTSWAGATPLCCGLPEEIIIWEILTRLPPKSLLRCRAVCRVWRGATSSRNFLQAHHGRQQCLPIVVGSEYLGAFHKSILTFNHRATNAKLEPVVRLEHSFYPEVSCDGLLILSNYCGTATYFSICNPATRQHVPLPQLSRFVILGMYPHRSTGEYRLLLRRMLNDQIGCYIFALGSDHPPRYIEGLGVTPSAYLHPSLVRDCLHWYPLLYHSDPDQHQIGSKAVTVFDTRAESFRQMRAPFVPAKSYIFEMDGTLGIYSYNDDMKTIDIWMLRDYESEVWRYKYSVKLPVREMKEQFGGWLNDNWYINVHSVDGDVVLLVNHGRWMFHVDTNGKLVDSFRRDDQHVYASQLRLKQTLVSHTFFAVLEGYDVNSSPFV